MSDQDRAKEQGERVAENLEQSPRHSDADKGETPKVDVNINQPAEDKPDVNVEHAEHVQSDR